MDKLKADNVVGLAVGLPGHGPTKRRVESINAATTGVAAAFNEWMRRYTEHPEEFAREWQTVSGFLAAEAAGEVPSYGLVCTAYLEKLVAELFATTVEA